MIDDNFHYMDEEHRLEFAHQLEARLHGDSTRDVEDRPTPLEASDEAQGLVKVHQRPPQSSELLLDVGGDLCLGLTALHNAAPHGRPEVMTIHPVVRVHPETGKKSLFVNEHFTRRIVELSHEESDILLGYLTKWVATQRFTLRYRWTAGTIAMWDNRCTQHKVLNDFLEERIIQRVTVMGDVPVGNAPKWEPFVRPGHASDTSRYDELLVQYLSQQQAAD